MFIKHTIGYDPIINPWEARYLAALSILPFTIVAFSLMTLAHQPPTPGVLSFLAGAGASWANDIQGLRGLAAVAIGLAGATIVCRHILKRTPPNDPFDILAKDSPKVWYDDFAREKLTENLTREAGAKAESGLYLAPHLRLPRAAETKNLLVVGNSGSGKSNIIRGLAEQFVERGDQVLFLCNKGDVTSCFSKDEAILIAAHHAHGHAWDLATDIDNLAAMMQFTSHVIEPSMPRFFSDSASTVLNDLLIAHARANPNWTPMSLMKAALTDAATIKKTIAGILGNSGRMLGPDGMEEENRTAASIILTLWASVFTKLRPLAWAWQEMPPERRFSINRWLSGEAHDRKPVIIQFSSDYAALSSLVAETLIVRIASRLSDPQLANDPRRRVVLVLDEFPVLDRIPNLQRALAVGREKGLVVILGAQSITQILEKYPGAEGQSLLNHFQFKIFTRQDPGDTLDGIVKMVGKQHIRVRLSNNLAEDTDKRKYISRDEWRDAFTPKRFAGELGIDTQSDDSGDVIGVVSAYGDLYRLRWPFTIWKKKRAGYVPAAWVSLNGTK